MASSSSADDTTFPQMTSPNGWHINENHYEHDSTSWLSKDGRIAIVIVLGALGFILITWYIVRSIIGMRRRLRQENEKQLQMIQQITSTKPPGDLYYPHSQVNPPAAVNDVSYPPPPPTTSHHPPPPPPPQPQPQLQRY
ncbi:hypothetical protein O0I10_006427 [Lichtheimia ornata]|uniref:Uncharacterized protein n=1 Tax=Lichtheimia ornata TaxID=688661 RepID=A0AAD7V327_9FUNG|nr:uncharacterized protein O0I10_006427 [Lichtheimia ornata]KAJ8657899.1 hypothetical protein O0I10_006427 [Lichtheimia ornata]